MGQDRDVRDRGRHPSPSQWQRSCRFARRAAIESGDDAIYLAISLRNVGNGIAVLDGWTLSPVSVILLGEAPHAEPHEFRRLTRDIYVASGDVGFWQGALREPGSAEFTAARGVGGALTSGRARA